MLAAGWLALHSITISAISMLYCIRMVPSMSIELDVLMGDVSSCLSLLSALGEHWSGAKRCREIVDDLARSTILWLKNRQGQAIPSDTTGQAQGSMRRPIIPDEFSMPLIEIQDSSRPISAMQAQTFGTQESLDPFSAYLGENLFGELADTQWMGSAFEDFISSSQSLP